MRSEIRYALHAGEENPKGEVHENIDYFGHDKVRRCVVLRQFQIEGFVNQYKLGSISAEGKTIYFVSEAIENIPTGWRAKESYQIPDANRLQETFDRAEPGKEFAVYSKVVLERVK